MAANLGIRERVLEAFERSIRMRWDARVALCDSFPFVPCGSVGYVQVLHTTAVIELAACHDDSISRRTGMALTSEQASIIFVEDEERDSQWNTPRHMEKSCHGVTLGAAAGRRGRPAQRHFPPVSMLLGIVLWLLRASI
jgi:hypothetical protein